MAHRTQSEPVFQGANYYIIQVFELNYSETQLNYMTSQVAYWAYLTHNKPRMIQTKYSKLWTSLPPPGYKPNHKDSFDFKKALENQHTENKVFVKGWMEVLQEEWDILFLESCVFSAPTVWPDISNHQVSMTWSKECSGKIAYPKYAFSQRVRHSQNNIVDWGRDAKWHRHASMGVQSVDIVPQSPFGWLEGWRYHLGKRFGISR